MPWRLPGKQRKRCKLQQNHFLRPGAQRATTPCKRTRAHVWHLFLRIHCEVRSKCTSRKGLFYLKTGRASPAWKQASPLKGRAPVAHCSLNPIMRNPTDNKWALANRMLLDTWAARPCLLNRGHKQAAKVAVVAVNINGSWPQVICHAPFAWRPAMMLGSCSCLGCGLVWAVYRREVAQL